MWKKLHKTDSIKNIKLKFAQEQTCFDVLQKTISPDENILVAISGGADSTLTACILYNFFVKQKYDLNHLFFIHCNHQTRRGNASDEKFIKKFLEWIQTIIVKRDTNKKSNEGQLRTWRYQEFKLQIKKHKIHKLILGHNLTDRIESTFLNLLRWSNINGFIAMQMQEQHHLLPDTQILRPIVQLTKAEILDICKHNKIQFVNDPTNNNDTTSLRNKLRNSVLPELYKLAHKQTPTTNSFIQSIQQVYAQVEKSFQEQNIILSPVKESHHRKTKFAYQRIVDPQDINKECVMQVMKQLNISSNITTPLLKERSAFLQKNESGYKYFNKTYLFKSHGKIYFISGPRLFWEKTIASSQKITKPWTINREKQNYEIDKKEYIGGSIRFPKKGDRYKNKTRNEWCINQKIPIFQRNFIPIIVKENQIIKIFN